MMTDENLDIPPEMVKDSVGYRFCSLECEGEFFSDKIEDAADAKKERCYVDPITISIPSSR